MTQGDRLNKIIDYLGISQRLFSEQLSVSHAFTSKIINNKTQISRNYIDKLNLHEKLNNSYHKLNTDWLLTGEGEMFITKHQGDKLEKTNVIVCNIPVNAGAGIPSQIIEETTNAYFPMIRSGAIIFPVQGNSMKPVIEDKDYIITYELQSPNQMKPGAMYVIKLQDSTTHCKYIDKRGSKWILRSENYQEHPPIEIESYKVDKVYNIELRITPHFGWEN